MADSIKGREVPIETLHLFPVLDKLLIELLQSLHEEEWNMPTIAKLWTVKDIASHLLDGNLRGLSASRDHYFGEKPPVINSNNDLTRFLNDLNMDWTKACKRLSPAVLIQLLELTGKQYSQHLQTLEPFEPAVFPVAWAGHSVSENWFHIAREYTEKFLHQQQIREATGRQALLTRELFYPFINTLMQGLPYTYENVAADNGTAIVLTVATEMGGSWTLLKTVQGWNLSTEQHELPDASVTIDPADAWKLFSKGVRANEVETRVHFTGNKELGKVALEMVSVMA